MVGFQMVGRQDGWENGVLRMSLGDIVTSWPLPLPMRDMVSRAVAQSAEDSVIVSWLYLRPVARAGGFQGFCQGGRLDG